MSVHRKSNRHYSIATSTETPSLLSDIEEASFPRDTTFKFCAQCLDDIYSLWRTVAFCKHCKEYICSDACLKQHAKYSLTKNHAYILDDDLKQYLRDTTDTNEAEQKIKDHNDSETTDNDGRKYPVLRTEYKIRAKQDKEICSIHATVVLQNGNLVMADLKNGNLKLFNTSARNCLSVLDIKNGPRDICISNRNEDELYVIETSVHGILRVGIKERELDMNQMIHTDSECYGVACWKNGIAVIASPYKTGYGKYELRLLDYEGRVRRKFTSKTAVNLEFSLPWYLCSNFDGQHVLISDYGNNTVTCVDVDNSSAVLFVYKDKDLVRPVAMATDSNDDIFIVGQRSHNVHHISAFNDKKSVMFSVKSRKDGLDFPGGIAYDSKNDLFYLQYMGWSDDMQAFNLSNVPSSDPEN